MTAAKKRGKLPGVEREDNEVVSIVIAMLAYTKQPR